jgi:hypothetical protein
MRAARWAAEAHIVYGVENKAQYRVGKAWQRQEVDGPPTIIPRTVADTVRSAIKPPRKQPAVSAASTVEISPVQV